MKNSKHFIGLEKTVHYAVKAQVQLFKNIVKFLNTSKQPKIVSTRLGLLY